ncbi:MAG: MFS transporter, partial [Acidimicrobiia bacterium]|nr:MFS transporter [Acidimicrobiia bacterium]NNL26949.1 MFS transporter [Acidimicrobiia bacterium]
LTGEDTFAGFPGSIGTLGAALGATVLTRLSKSRGRRMTFIGGYLVAAAGGVIAAFSIIIQSLMTLMAGFLLVGFGRSVSQLARFAAADMRSEERRGRAISTIVWAGTIGAVVGPRLISPAGEIAVSRGQEALLGPMVLMAAGLVLAALGFWIWLRPDPMSLAIDTSDQPVVEKTKLSLLLRHDTVWLGLTGLVVSQFVMVFIMTMTPLHLDGNGYDLNDVGWVMTAHTAGMFAFAPLTGWLVDRMGSRWVLAAGSLMLIGASFMAARALNAELPVLLPGLFLLGLGWNFGYVSSSTVLQSGLELQDRLGLQGLADSSTWISGGLGALLSGVIVHTTSFATLSLAGAALALIPLAALLMLIRRRERAAV